MEVEEAGFRLIIWRARCYMHKYAGSCAEAGQGAISRLVALQHVGVGLQHRIHVTRLD